VGELSAVKLFVMSNLVVDSILVGSDFRPSAKTLVLGGKIIRYTATLALSLPRKLSMPFDSMAHFIVACF
jgi:hypothetical protein